LLCNQAHSLAIHPWVCKVGTGDDYHHCWKRKTNFCIRIDGFVCAEMNKMLNGGSGGNCRGGLVGRWHLGRRIMYLLGRNSLFLCALFKCRCSHDKAKGNIETHTQPFNSR